ncbi:hypothetical protein PYDG_00010 [Pseudoalteromonas phage pYD6-A]|uniref:Uncharacterized protein n=1 Tax=Pseudoalteromonas phage pYD6-A TaxID=754052 RepID=M4SMF0_9CAUD|nr:hypothetical protein PYDG_00010 [Pseudoalteromonas phage pYD6-A]AGH57542.1 hypothetical protein PYDG_00010 [Pseudoalteromonas phage pYD6-A]
MQVHLYKVVDENNDVIYILMGEEGWSSYEPSNNDPSVNNLTNIILSINDTQFPPETAFEYSDKSVELILIDVPFDVAFDYARGLSLLD